MMMKIVKFTALSLFLMVVTFIFVLSYRTRNSFTQFDYGQIMENMTYNLDFISQGIEQPDEFLLSMESQAEYIVVGEVTGLKRIQNVLFYEIKTDDPNDTFLLFSNGNFAYSSVLERFIYDTNFYYKPLFIGYKYIFFLQKFTETTIFSDGKPVYQLSQISHEGTRYNRYYSVYNASDETVILNDYDEVEVSQEISDYIVGFKFQEIDKVDIYYHKNLTSHMINNYKTLKEKILDKYWVNTDD